MKDSLKNKLKTQYESHSQNIPNDLWDRIEAVLDDNKSETNLPLFNYKWASLAAVFLLFISLGFIYFNSDSESKQVKTPNLTAKIIKPIIKNTSEGIIQNKNLNRVELALQKTTYKKIKTKKIKFLNQKFLNQIDIKDNVVQEKSTDSQSIAKNLIKEKPTISIAKKEIKENVKYTSAKDLLFGYEIEKTNSEMEKSHLKLGVIEIKKPKEITILGIKVYSEDSGN